MADREVYLNNTDDQISQQKRSEQQGKAVLTVGATITGLAAILIAKRKLALSRAFSTEVRTLGSSAAHLTRYGITEIARSASTITRTKGVLRNIYEGLRKPLPTGLEQAELASLRLARSTGINFKGVPDQFRGDIANWGFWRTMRHGAIAPLAPGARITMPGATHIVGEHGAMVGGGHLFDIGPQGDVSRVLSGINSGMMGTSGSRVEHKRGFTIPHNYSTKRDFVAGKYAPPREDVLMEQKRRFAEYRLNRAGRGHLFDSTEETSSDLLMRMSAHMDDLAFRTNLDDSSRFFNRHSKRIQKSTDTALNRMIDQQLAKPGTTQAYNMYKLQMRAGVGEPFAVESGQIQSRFYNLRAQVQGRAVDPFSGRQYSRSNAGYHHGESVSGAWESGGKGTFYAFPSDNLAKRAVGNFLEGTYFRTFEQTTGFGLSVAPTKLTDWISHLTGAQRGSYGDFFTRQYIGGHARLAALGVGAYTTFQLVNYLSRKATGGWGVTDVAGKLYTSAREFQQRVIDQAGLVGLAKKTEKAFPGTVKSPLSVLARASAPFWMASLGHRASGKSGALVGLGLGIATALVTWGDITQSPDELHRIYTGEQDIPIRKGRYWMFGKTPLGGGKISYWRPHWYPLLRSKYKQRGQLYDSPEEELASTSPIGPLINPVLTGRMWDPYGWEKKHYYDRPYPLTGELFEPTMPFAWLLNSTVGGLIKPQRVMHEEYYGSPQSEGPASRTVAMGTAGSLGFQSAEKDPFTPKIAPNTPTWRFTEALYAQSEQMGFTGFMVKAFSEKLTGRTDFLPEGPVVQSASRATGLERSYWDLNIGDPGGFTEFLRRAIPHRRRGIEEYNPIPNTMPSWLPGEDYFTNFRTGDPYTKVEMGEARLPGPGYESLHKLHSGKSGEYDAVDRFLILADIAPYSREYAQAKFAVQSAVRGDKYWEDVVNKHMQQRDKLNEEYEFLDLNPPEDVTGFMRPASAMYRRVLASITGAGTVLDPLLSLGSNAILGGGGASPFFMAMFPIAKLLPYKTARQTYKDSRLLGSDFTDWGNPFRDFVQPYLNKVIDTVSSRFGVDYIPQGEKERREYEDYFDRMQYIKFRKLQRQAEDSGNADVAKKMKAMAGSTMVGMDPHGNQLRMMGSIPKRERAFMQAFTNAEGSERDAILKLVSPQMARIYKAQWSMRDGTSRGRVNTDAETVDSMINYSRDHNIPEEGWAGWNPEVDMKDIQLKTVQNEGMNIHNFDLWESQARAMNRRPFVPSIGNINAPIGNAENLRRAIQGQLENDSYSDTKMYMTNTSASRDSVNLKIKVKRNRSKERKQQMEAAFAA